MRQGGWAPQAQHSGPRGLWEGAPLHGINNGAASPFLEINGAGEHLTLRLEAAGIPFLGPGCLPTSLQPTFLTCADSAPRHRRQWLRLNPPL